MNPLLKFKTSTLFLIPLVLVCFALLPKAQAVTPELLPAPAPDGAYAGLNTAEGFNALFNLTTGTLNTAIGFSALKADTSGGSNTAVGAQALLHNNGSNNTAIGVNALVHNTTGSQNTAAGQGALTGNTSGDFNGDGKADILWQNSSTGQRVIWLMNGTTHQSTVNLGTVGTSWSIRNY